MTIELSDLDRRLLAAVQSDAALSQEELAHRVGASPASCWRRLKRLEEDGALGPLVRLVNPVAINRTVNVLCNVRLKAPSSDARDSFARFVGAHAEIMECYAMSGEWDYLLRVVVRDVADYERFLMRILLLRPEVATASSHFALARIKYTTALPI